MSTQTHPASSARFAAASVIFLSVVLLAVTLAKEFDLIDGAVAKRAVAIVIGAVLIVTANILPKVVGPISMRRRNPVGVIAAERFAGWTFVVVGVIYIAVWLVVPLEHVMLVSSLIGLTAFLLVVAKWGWLMRRAHPFEPQEADLGEHARHIAQGTFVMRCVIFLILHAIFWVFAMFLADSIWGDVVAQWMAVVFGVANGVLLTMFATMNVRSRHCE